MRIRRDILCLVSFTGLCLVSLLGGPIARANDENVSLIPAAFAFEDGQLVSYSETVPEQLPPTEAQADSPRWLCTPWPRGGEIERAAAKIPELLPEGMVPPITGKTAEERRHYGVGEPLEGTSWLACSHSAGMFLGPIGGAALIDDQLEQCMGGMFGLRFGIDYDHRWGLEKRFGFAQMDVFDVIHHQRQIINVELGDVDLLFYPWGDTRWRPYMSVGGGLAHFNYQSEIGRRIDRLLVGLPFGIGLKYFWNQGVALRAELVDNMMLGTHELSTMNNVSLALGIEFRYDGFHLGKSKH